MVTIKVPFAFRILSELEYLKPFNFGSLRWVFNSWLIGTLILQLGVSGQERTRLTMQGENREQVAIRRVLEEQAKAWNEGSIEKYMEGYWKSDSLVFTSGGKITRGWKTTLDRYKKAYATRELMGALSFSDLEISVLDESTAWVLGKWKLIREKDTPHGIFTLVLRRFPDGWKIVHDHTTQENQSRPLPEEIRK